ncbi:MAG TPA: PrsW family glutamic-type intramembrane protease [Candidatus Eisenbacteria bacterium]|nr:PrsW family glutamic-type intramembrane protease [Candidatus Eisenbacteria bacterium]
MTALVPIVVGLGPVIVFLAALVAMDSYRLVRRRDVAMSLAWGALAALLAWFANGALLARGMPRAEVTGTFAPLFEEALKAAWVVVLLATDRVGFLVDAGIHGFAIGTGFALVENASYAHAIGSGPVLLWVARGLGTAVMHGATTAVVAIAAKALAERHHRPAWLATLAGWAPAVVVHALFNRYTGSPLVSTTVLLVTMPLLLLGVFEWSERATRRWVGAGLDQDADALEQMLGDTAHDTPAGRYLAEISHRFPPAAVADMFCLLRIHLELSVRAKALLMARAAGVEIPLDDDELRAQFTELKFLERSIGRAGLLALAPLRRKSSRDLWQLLVLQRGSLSASLPPALRRDQ